MTPIADWLRATRKRHAMPNGRPWTQEYMVQQLNADGWTTLHEANYVNWENGRGMRPSSLERLIEFWAKHGEPGPDLTEPEPVLPVEERQLALLERQTEVMLQMLEAANRRADAAERRADAIEAWARSISGVPPIPAEDQDEIDRFHNEQARGARRPVRQENQPVSGRA